MGIEKDIEIYKKTRNKKLFEHIISYYKPLFKEKIRENYGNKYDEKIDDLFLNLVNYYFENELKDKLVGFLRNKSKTVFNPTNDFNYVINSEEKEKIKKHYINKMYNGLKKQNKQKVLLDNELYDVVSFDVDKIFNSYLKSDKISRVSNYFNSQINRKLCTYKDEEKLVLSYAKNVKVTEKIQRYFYKKYSYLLDEYKITFDLYKKYIDELLFCDIHSSKADFELSLRKKIKFDINEQSKKVNNEIDKLKTGKDSDLTFIKEYYSYIKNTIFEKYKDLVFISEEELKKIIDLKYDKYFNVAVEYIKRKPKENLARYINNRLSNYILNAEWLFVPFYVDADKKEKTIDENLSMIDNFLERYKYLYDNEVLLKIIQNSYYEAAELFYQKQRKATFHDFVRNHIRADLRSINFSDADEVSKYVNNL